MLNAITVIVDVTLGLPVVFILLASKASDVQSQRHEAPDQPRERAPWVDVFEGRVLDAPEPNDGRAPDFGKPSVTILGKGHEIRKLYLGSEQIAIDALKSRLQAEGHTSLVICSDPALSNHAEKRVKRICMDAGVEAFEDVFFKKMLLNRRQL